MTGSPAPTGAEDVREREPREWPRVLALGVFLVTTWLVNPLVLVGAPFLLLLMGLPVTRKRGLLLGAVVAFLLLAGPSPDGFWYMERAWGFMAGGFFLALGILKPGLRLTHRAVGSVVGAGAVSGALFALRPEAWRVVDFTVRERVTTGVTQVLAALRSVQGDEVVTQELEASLLRTVEVQVDLFPALVGLTTLAGLALAWWAYRRVAVGERPVLAPVKDFRFEDQLIWVFIAGLLLVVVAAGDAWTRVGSNTLVFMGALYALRGVAVFLFLNGGLTLFGGLLLAVAILFMAPILAMAALLIGLGDTWLDVRAKARALLG